MAHTLTIPFFASRLRFHSGGSFLLPLADQAGFHLERSIDQLAERYAERFQETVLDRGNFLPLLAEYQEGPFFTDRLSVAFEAAKDGQRHPAFSVEFDFVFAERDGRWWGTVPALGIESMAGSEEKLRKYLEEAVRLDFVREQRLNAMQRVVAAIWFDSLELLRSELSLRFPSPAELDLADREHSKPLLPVVAEQLKLRNPQTYGRKAELDQLIRALKNPFNRNVLLVGASGVGKTALIWELARLGRQAGLEQPIWETTASVLIKELTRDTGWQDNLTFLLRELKQRGGFLFVRNLMELFEVGQYEGNAVSMAEYLQPFLARGELHLLTECTEEERARIELRSPNYLSIFHEIRLDTPRDELEDIIERKVGDLAGHHQVRIEAEAIREVIRLNQRFSPYAGFPGKPIRFLESLLLHRQEDNSSVERAEVIARFCEETGLPSFMVDPDIPMELDAVGRKFAANVYGQERAVDSLVNLLASVKTALSRTGKPIASFLFVGPTGVGKTELAKVLAEFMFGSRDRLTRFDMSEYSSAYDVMRLTGLSFRNDGLLTSAVRREPFCVLLFDEIEKAHSDFSDLLLQILGEGRLTDSRGKLVNFCSCIVIMTSNIGASKMQGNRISLKKELDTKQVTEHFLSAVRAYFRPELFNRIDQVIPFEPLSRPVVRQVVDRELQLLQEREGIRFRRMHLQLAPEVYDYLAEHGYHAQYGARHLQRIIRERLIVPLARALNAEDFDDQLVVTVAPDGEKLRVEVEADPLGLELLFEELEKINLADWSSALRRRVARIREGHFFIQLLSELDLLERDKQRLGQKFWRKARKVARYQEILQTSAEVTKLEQGIEELEMSIALSTLGAQPYQPVLGERLKEWEERFRLGRIDLFRKLHSKTDECYLAVYGSLPERPLAFYRDLCRRRGYELSGEALWFSETYYHSIDPEQGQRVRLDYERRPWDFDRWKSNFSPADPGETLYGAIWKISGPACAVYLRPENGLQQWRWSNDEDHLYVVQLQPKKVEPPPNIHRREFYKSGSPFRVVEPQHLRDTRFRQNLQIDRNTQVDVIGNWLDELFEETVANALG